MAETTDMIDNCSSKDLKSASKIKSLRAHGPLRMKTTEVSWYVKATGLVCVEPDDPQASLLPPNVCGIDVQNCIELRSALIVTANDEELLWAGQSLESSTVLKEFNNSSHWFSMMPRERRDVKPRRYVRVINPESGDVVRELSENGVFEDLVLDVDSKLLKHTDATVVSVSHRGKTQIAQIEVRYLASLRSDTLIYILRGLNVIQDSDFPDSTRWRDRLKSAAKKGLASLV